MADMQEDEDALFPQSFFCPLTHEVMKDPVQDTEGNSYERTAIEAWLQNNSTSPITRNPLHLADLVPNRALRNAIEERQAEIAALGSKGEPAPPVEKKVVAQEQKPQPQDEPVTIAATCRKIEGEDYVLVSIQPPQGAERTPSDICCVVDVSGSMGEEATLRTESGALESHGLSLLDVVKHAVKTIICAMKPQDRLALVVYSSEAKTVFKLTQMTEPAKKTVISKLDDLEPGGSTNLWGGLQMGMELLREDVKPDRLKALLLLTDGLPNVSPPRGELAMLQQYKQKHEQLSCAISTFGFGYGINSALLKDIAVEGNGMYSFIPDSSFVGTAFVNGVSQLLVTMAKNVDLSLEPLNGAKIEEIVGGHVKQTTSWGALVHLGTLQYGQSKDLVIRVSSLPADQPYLSAKLKYETRSSGKTLECSAEASKRDGAEDVEFHRFRLMFVDCVKQAMNKMKINDDGDALALVKQLINKASSSSDKRVQAIVEDLSGQVMQAISRRDWYTKWGVHYLPSLMHAHLLQQCSNFKDPGLQGYGGELFRDLRDEVDDLFCKLPAPKPSIKKAPVSSSSRGSSYRTTPVSMSVYNSASNPCFGGDCLVLLEGGAKKKVSAVAKGDRVQTPSGKSAEVVCVVKTLCKGSRAELVELPGGLLVTPYHPVRVEGEWRFPLDLAEPAQRPCPAVYSFVLAESHVMLIDGVECVTLGHSFQGEVVGHPYFGSPLVLSDLQRQPTWDSGLVQFNHGCAVRDPNTGLICALRNSLDEA